MAGDQGLEPIDVHRDELAGVPVHWTEIPGERQVAIMFRAGRVDETPTSAGLSHLVEHLALYPFGRGVHSYNGFVDDTRTVFYASGTPEETSRFLEQVTSNVSNLPLDRLEQERQVLLTEGHGRPAINLHRQLRFGVCGYGMGALGELGLHGIDAEQLQEWASLRYNRSNATIWCSGPPPEVDLELPRGVRYPPPPPDPLEGLELPAFSAQGQGGVSLTWIAPRSSALSIATSLAHLMAEENLRRTRAVSYEIGGAYEHLGGERAQCGLFADCLPEHAATVRDALLGVLDEITAGRAPEAQIELLRTQWRRSIADPLRAAGLLDGAAKDELFGVEVLPPGDLLAEIEAVGPQDVAGAIGDALPTLLMLVPAGVGADRGRFRFIDGPESDAAVEGRAFHRAAKLKRLRGARQELILGEDGVSYVNPSGEPTTIRFADCVAVAAEGNGYRIHARDGNWIFTHFDTEEQRREIAEILSSGVPDELWVETDPSYPQRLAGVDAKLKARGIRSSGEGHRAAGTLAKTLIDGESLREVGIVQLGESEDKLLLAVTDMRVAWLTGNENDTRFAAIESVVGAEAKGKLWNRKLVLRVGQDRVEMTSTGGASPAELAAAVNHLLAASSPTANLAAP